MSAMEKNEAEEGNRVGLGVNCNTDLHCDHNVEALSPLSPRVDV